MSVKIESNVGPYGRGTYIHTCYSPTFCTEADGIGDSCGGETTFEAEAA